MIAVDSSVAVAAFGEWHRLNEPARSVLDAGAAIPCHALMETYSVLTGYPAPYRPRPSLVDTWLDDRFATILEPPAAGEVRELLRDLAAAGTTGGAAYDALVALTVSRVGATLITADRRATAVYSLVGVDVRFLA